MKSLFYLLVISLMGGVAAAQEPSPNLERDSLKGPVKTVEHGRTQYVFDGEKRVEGKPTLVQELRFNERGNRIESTSYRETGAIAAKLVYTYDVLGRNTGYDEYYNLTGPNLLGPRKHVFTIDANGKTVEQVVYETDGIIGSRFTYQYDDKGNKIEESFHSWTGKSLGRLVYSYDQSGHLLTQTSYDGEEAVSWKNVSSYDSEGHQTEWAQYQKGVLRYKKVFQYDAKGRIKEQGTFEFNAPPNFYVSHAPVPGRIVYLYNDSERSREILTYDAKGTLKSRDIRSLDENGNEIGTSFINGDNSPSQNSGDGVRIKIEYDSHGNWTKKIRMILTAGAKQFEARSTEYRKITYHE